MTPTPIHWSVLKFTAWLQTGPYTVPLDELVRLTRYSPIEVLRAARDLMRSDFSEDGAWLAGNEGYYSVSGVRSDPESAVTEASGGWLALEGAQKRPYFEEYLDAQWKTEALTGLTNKGEKSEITRAVLPAVSTQRYAGVPEDRAQRANMRLLGREGRLEEPKMEGSGFRYCPTCKSELISKEMKRCRPCDRMRKRKSRAAAREEE